MMTQGRNWIIDGVKEWTYEKKFCGVGTFEMVAPIAAVLDSFGRADADLARQINTDTVFDAYGEGFDESGEKFLIKQVDVDDENVTISGYDLNGLLLSRITVAQSEDGADRVKGSTETIVKHFVDVNCVNPDDTNRVIPNLKIAIDKGRGNKKDAAYSRFERVSDVITEILAAQGYGWRISGDYAFDIVISSSVSSTLYLGGKSKNADGIASTKSTVDSVTTLYCGVLGGAVQEYNNKAKGLDRSEEFTDLGCELDEVDIYAKHELQGKNKAEATVLENVAPEYYFTLPRTIDVGTRVHVTTTAQNISGSVTALKVTMKGGERSLSITVGNPRAKKLDRVEKKASAAVDLVNSLPPAVKTGGVTDAMIEPLVNTAVEAILITKETDWVGIRGGKGIKVKNATPGYMTSDNNGANIVNHMAPGVEIRVQDKDNANTSYGVMELGNNVFTVKSSHTTSNAVDYILELGGPMVRFLAPLFDVGFQVGNGGECKVYMGKQKTLTLKLDKENQALHLRGIKKLYIEDTKVFDIENDG